MSLQESIELAKDIGRLADATNNAVEILAKALLELDQGELSDGKPCLTIGTRQALERLADRD